MKKKKLKQSAIANSSIQCFCEIDYEKLATAIVKAQRAVTNNKETAKDNIEKKRKISTIKRIWAIIRGKEDTETKFTVGLFALLLSLLCKVVALLLGLSSVCEIIYGFIGIDWAGASIGGIALNIVMILMLFFIGIMFTLIFYIVSLEMEKTKNDSIVFQAFSGMTALVALIVAIIALYE